MKNFKELKVWQKSVELVTSIYQTTKVFPKEEQFGIINQIRRCAVSVPSNIAEGFGRNSDNDFKRFLSISKGSLYEFETQLEISYRLNYIGLSDFETLNSLAIEIDKMINGLIKSLNKKY